MLSIPVSLSNATATSPPDSDFIFNKGDLLNALVREVKPDGMLSLLVQGRLLEALSETAGITKGQRVQLLVEDIRDGRVYMKVVPPEISARSGEQDLSESLQASESASNSQDVAIARSLLRHGLPVTRDNMTAIHQAISSPGADTLRNIEIAALALAGGLPLNQKVLTALAQYFTPDGDSDLGQIIGKLSRLADSAGSSAIPEPAVGQDYEVVHQRMREIVQELTRQLVISAQDDPSAIADKLMARVRDTRPLVQDMKATAELLKQSETGWASPVGKELVGQLENLERNIGAQQLANILGRNLTETAGQPADYYISFPVQVGDQHRQVQLKIVRDRKAPHLKDAQKLSLVVGLDTSNLGQVLFHVDWAKIGPLGLKGVVERPDIARYLGDLSDLSAALAGKGYLVENRGIAVSRPGAKPDRLRPDLGASDQANLFRVDIQA